MSKILLKETREEKDKKLITRAYRQLLRSIKVKTDKTDKTNIRAAYELAVDAHRTQRRKSGEPYVLHPIEVARICTAEIGLGATAIICALLHDVVEDTPVSLDDLKEQFGERVALIVNGLTKLDFKSENSADVESPQAENFKKVLSTLTVDVRVVLIKMADRLHNMRTLGAMPPHKQVKIAAETSFIYSPLAHRLGLYKMKTEFEDLSMKITNRDVYADISQKLQATKKERNRYIKEFIEPLEKELKENMIPYRTTGRPKSIYSIWNKLKKKKVPFEEIYDLFAVRIIVDVPPSKEKSICWQVYSIITDVYLPIPERLKDWVTVPKANGYESLHTTVVGPKGRFVEVQIRSERMDDIAERGFAAHWKYKKVSKSPNVYDAWLNNVREILDNSSMDAIDFLNDFKTNLFNEEVYVYTPKGDMRVLPKGGTALDFAFSIHSDVGYHATAIKVNNKLVPMGHVLQNGDQVHITTNKSQKPSESWLKMVATGKARNKIRSAMKEERKKEGQIGRETLERKFKNIKADFVESNIEIFAKFLKYKSHVDLYFDISKEKLNPTELLKNFTVEGGKLSLIVIKEEKLPQKPVVTTKQIDPSAPRSGLHINGESADHLDYSFATCCNPVSGDSIFAYLSNNGLKIHRSNCPNATNLAAKYGYRILRADWESISLTNFAANLVITGVDTGIGVIEAITHTISSDLGLNIRSFSIASNEGIYECQISLHIKDKAQLQLVIKTLKQINGVDMVTRVE
ncbi:MAG: bifunctional (p)ppGpp synthetase/guanosine-3',5'-bis(diphosphate) 3'-pyrophosphohydrolase [Saprospiraceae bacterium]